MIKMIRIRYGEIGLVFKNGKLINLLKEGIQFVLGSSNVEIHSRRGRLQSEAYIDVLLGNDQLATMVDELNLGDQEIALIFEDDIYLDTLRAGRFLFWKGSNAYSWTILDKSKIDIPDSVALPYKEMLKRMGYAREIAVTSGSEAILLKNGLFYKHLKAGKYYYWSNGETLEVAKAEMRWTTLEVSGQELLTLDKATVRLNVNAEFKVVDLKKAVLENKAYEKQLYTAIQMELRDQVGALTLDKLLESKHSVAVDMGKNLATTAERLGLKIGLLGIRDIILTGDMREIMNRVIIAEKEAQAGAIKRREESAATRMMLNTAKLMDTNDMLYRLKEMEFVEKMATQVGEITITGNGGMVKQLKEIFAVGK